MKRGWYIVGGIIVIGGLYGFALKRAEQKVLVSATASIAEMHPKTVVLRLNYNIKNPTSALMYMTAPLIKLSIEGKELASSSLEAVEIPENVRDSKGRIIIRPYKETGFISTLLTIPTSKLLGLSAIVYRRLTTTNPKDKIDISINIESQIFVPTKLASFPYSSNIPIKL